MKPQDPASRTYPARRRNQVVDRAAQRQRVALTGFASCVLAAGTLLAGGGGGDVQPAGVTGEVIYVNGVANELATGPWTQFACAAVSWIVVLSAAQQVSSALAFVAGEGAAARGAVFDDEDRKT